MEKTLRLIYKPQSLEISRVNGMGDSMAMWDVFNSNTPLLPEGTTVCLDTVKAIRAMGVVKAAEWRLTI